MEALRVAANVRYEAYCTLQAARETHNDAVIHLRQVVRDKRLAGLTVIELAEKRQLIRAAADKVLEELRPIIEAVEHDEAVAKRKAHAAYLRGDHRMSRTHRDEARDLHEEGRPLRRERQQHLDAKTKADAEVKAAARIVEKLATEHKKAKQALFDAKQAIEVAESRVLETEIAYGQADRRYAAAQQHYEARQAQARREWRRAASRAGVPHFFHDQLYIETKVTDKEEEETHIYFGGLFSPEGEHHGHYILTEPGKVRYKRDPFQPHGPHNHLSIQ